MKAIQDSSVSAVQIGDTRVEFHDPDLGLAYSALAPLVSEAWAFLQCGKSEEALKSLRAARAVIETATMVVAVAETPGINTPQQPIPSPGGDPSDGSNLPQAEQTMTYMELYEQLANLTYDKLSQPIRCCGSEVSGTRANIVVVAEDLINPSGDGWEPVSNYANEPEAIVGEPVVVKAGTVLLDLG